MEEKSAKAPKAKHLLRDIIEQHYTNAWEAKKRGDKVGWCASNFPQEICETLGVPVVYPENQAAAISAKGAGLKMCEHSESKGYSNDICAYARISLAYMDLKKCEEMDMPQPDFVLCCNNICNQMIKWYENIANELEIPMILIDIPYNTEFETSDDRVKYIRAQFDYAIEQLEKITGKTKVIIPVHTFGQPAEMAAILELAEEHNFKVIEDAACALGARYNNDFAGTVGDIGCFSFHARKGITTGEGGMVVTNNKNLAEKIRNLSVFGMTSAWDREKSTEFNIPGIY